MVKLGLIFYCTLQCEPKFSPRLVCLLLCPRRGVQVLSKPGIVFYFISINFALEIGPKFIPRLAYLLYLVQMSLICPSLVLL